MASEPTRLPAAAAPPRAWWLRTALVLSAPRAVFVALRADDDEDAAQRAEPVLAIVLLAGIAFVLSTSTTAHIMDTDQNGLHYDGLLVAVWEWSIPHHAVPLARTPEKRAGTHSQRRRLCET